MMNNKKTALVTGASKGIGAAIAQKLAEHGYQVAVNYLHSKTDAENLSEKIGGLSVMADVADYKQVTAMVNQIYQSFGNIDVLVNNAAISVAGLFQDVPAKVADRLFHVNINGVLNCSKAVLPDMINRKSGKIINIASMWGITGASCEVHYSTSKAAVIGFTKALAKETGPSGIQVNCVSPGLIMTEMNAHLSSQDIAEIISETPLNRIGTPQDIAEMVCFLASEKADFITGQNFNVNGGLVI